MRFAQLVLARLRALWRRDVIADEIREEMDVHLQMRTEKLVQDGLAPEAARRAAAQAFGNLAVLRDRGYDVRGGGLIESLALDLRYAGRLLRRQYGYATVAILTMALGIGATTTIFSVAYGVLLKPLPWSDADRVMRITETRKGKPARLAGTMTNGSYLAWSENPSTIDALGGYSVQTSSANVRVVGKQESLRIAVGRLTPSMFQVLKASPQRGRVFVSDDARIGGGAYPRPRVVILSYGLWQDVFGGRDTAIGETLRVDDLTVTIIGVMPPDFVFPDRDTRAWLPMPIAGVLGDEGVRRVMVFGALARLKAGLTVAQAAAEATARARSAPDPGLAAVSMFGSSAPPDISVIPAIEAMTADVKPAITLLLVGAALLLVTAIANIGSLQLARATTRRREMALRAALGAGSARLARQLMVESALVGVAGGITGLFLTVCMHRVLPSLLPADFPRVADIAISRAVWLFTLITTMTASAVCGIMPAYYAGKVDLVSAFGENNTNSTSGGWRSRAGRLRTFAMSGQVALACLLLVGAALVGRSFAALMHADRGYDPVNLLTARVDLGANYDGPKRVAFADAIITRLHSVSGVSEIAAGNALPFLGMGSSSAFAMPSPTDPGIKEQVQAFTSVVSPSYFQALRLRLLEGRNLSDADTLTSRPVAVVNRSFVAHYLGSSPVGALLPIRFGEGRPDCQVVGVVEDVRSSVTNPPPPAIFISYRQRPEWLNAPLLLVVRTTDDPAAHVPILRAAINEEDRTVAVDSVVTMEERVLTNLAKPRLYAVLLGAFGFFALAIAGVGLFGVLSFAVTQRSREIGVRTALGAQTRDIIGLVLKHAVLVMLTGTTLGLAASFVLSGFLKGFLYGVTPHDWPSFVAVAAILAVVGGIACLVPARRAARVDPLVVLKSS
jgi:predicted permease